MEYEVDLTTFTYGGETMGRLPDGRAVFVPFGLPGERVRVRLVEEKRGFARGKLLQVLSPAPGRITPRCRHFSVCGGCHYQTLSYENQLLAKTQILRDQLRRIGKIEDPPLRPMTASPQEWAYRNQVQFHVTVNGKLGFVNSRGNQVFPILECHLPEPAINTFWPELQFGPHTNIERVSVRAGADDELMLLLESNSPETPELEIAADVSVVHVFEEKAVIIAGREHFFIDILQKDFRVAADSFFQVNTKMAEKMVEYLLEKLPVESSSVLMDVYCGVGLFSKFFAPKCGRVIGVESSKSACEDFAFNLDEFDHVELYEGSAEDVIPHLDVKPDVVLVDPPRAGLEKRVVDGILRMNPRLVAYVSCDPSTLARDAARLINGNYRLMEVAPFDLFPQTYHIESISIFEKEQGRRMHRP